MTNPAFFPDHLTRSVRRLGTAGEGGATSHTYRPARRVAFDIRRRADRHLGGW